MPRHTVHQAGWCLVLCALPGCAAIDEKATATAATEAASERGDKVESAQGEGESPRSEAPPSPQESESVRDDPNHAIWQDPEFRRRFAESYIAETDVEPKVTAIERDGLQRALDLLAAEKADEAVKLLEAQRNPASSAVLDFTVANIHYQSDRFDQARACYQAAVTKYPKFRRAWRNLGLIHLRERDHAGAAKALTRLIELGGGDAFSYGSLGSAYLHLDRSTAAESAYRMATLLDADNATWQLGLVQSFFRQKRFADAVAACERLIAVYPDRADLWLLQANALAALNQPIKAAENLEFVDRLGQSTVDSLLLLGDIYTNEDLFDRAVSTYLRALGKTPRTKPDRVVRAARALVARGGASECKPLLAGIENAFGSDLDSEHRKELLRLRARMAVAEGAGDEEARVLREIVEIDPLDGNALILLGQHSSRAGDADKATFYYERAASLGPFEADAKVRLAQVLVGRRQYAAALPLLRRAQELKPRENVQDYLEQVERFAQAR